MNPESPFRKLLFALNVMEHKIRKGKVTVVLTVSLFLNSTSFPYLKGL